MNREASLIAKKYAQALLNLYDDQFDLAVVQQCRALATHLQSHPHIGFFLRMSALDDTVKQEALCTLYLQFELPPAIDLLIKVLSAHKRIYLCQDVLCAIYEDYLERHGILEFKIISAHALSQSDVQVMQQFLAHNTGQTIIYTSHIDRALIAGVRLISQNILWQYSIANQLRRVMSVVAE